MVDSHNACVAEWRAQTKQLIPARPRTLRRQVFPTPSHRNPQQLSRHRNSRHCYKFHRKPSTTPFKMTKVNSGSSRTTAIPVSLPFDLTTDGKPRQVWRPRDESPEKPTSAPAPVNDAIS